jgi:N-acetylglucosamine-6-phosphate deacetylase
MIEMAVFLQKIFINRTNKFLQNETFTSWARKNLTTDQHSTKGRTIVCIFIDINMHGMNGLSTGKNKSEPYADKVFVAMVSSYSPAINTTDTFNYKQVVVHLWKKPSPSKAAKNIMELP